MKSTIRELIDIVGERDFFNVCMGVFGITLFGLCMLAVRVR